MRHDAAYLEWYREGKGGAMMNDLEVIALDIKIWTGIALDIEHVAGWLLALSLLPAAAAVLLYVSGERVNALARSLLSIEPDGTARGRSAGRRPRVESRPNPLRIAGASRRSSSPRSTGGGAT